MTSRDRHEGMVGATAAAIAEAVGAGRVSPVAVARAHLARIDGLDALIGAFQTVRREALLADAAALAGRADLAELPLAGVPVAVKDDLAVAGTPSRQGTPASPADPAAADDELVARLRAAGALLLGTTRMPELGLWPVTEPRAFGPTRNPWDLTRTPGGSSGGAAAALAAGMTPLAVASDGAGSIRIPAACCGLVGLKPGRGVVPLPQGRPHWQGMTAWGPMATTVADAARLLGVLAGAPPHPLPGQEAPATPRRVAVSDVAPAAGIRVHARDRSAAAAAAAALQQAGHHLTEHRPPYRSADAARVIAQVLTGTAADAAEVTWEALEPRTRRQARAGQLLTAARRLGGRDPGLPASVRDRCVEWFESTRTDALLTPALASPPPKVGAWRGRGFLWALAASARFMPFSPLANLTGLPAIAVPAGVTPQGLPIGVQLLGPPGSEGVLLALAATLEHARPWPRHAPLADS